MQRFSRLNCQKQNDCMKKYCFLLSLTGLLLFSCKKSDIDDLTASLGGTWKMILVTDNTSTTSITKPSSIQNDVIITFLPSSASTGTFTGKTPTNDIDQNPYSLGPHQAISIPVLSMTKVAETSWGAEFVDNIRDAQQYSFATEGKINIRTRNKTLTFQKQ